MVMLVTFLAIQQVSQAYLAIINTFGQHSARICSQPHGRTVVPRVFLVKFFKKHSTFEETILPQFQHEKISIKNLKKNLWAEIFFFYFLWDEIISVPCQQILVQACLRAPHVVADQAKLALVFPYFLFSFFSFFFYAFCFSSTSRNLPCVKICFPQYFGITRRYMQKKTFLGVIFEFFLTK